MPSISKKVLAQNCVIVVTPLSEVGGVFSESTSQALTGRAGRISMEHRFNTEEVSGNDSLQEDHVITKIGWRLSLEKVKHISGPDLEDVIIGFSYAKATVQSPRGVGTRVRTYYGTFESHTWTIEPGRNLDVLNLLPVDIGSANPLFVG